MSAFLVTRGMGGQVVASAGFGTPMDETDEPEAWNIIGTELREKDPQPTIFSQYTNLSKKTL